VLKGHYRIDALIGGGGMALVYRAFDLNLQRVCAIKQNLDTTPQAQQQFHVEAITLANLSHPHLARVTDHFVDTTGQQYLVMDFVDGENLDAYVARNGPLSERQALAWMRGIFDALAYCHSQGVIHRDIKPANLIKRRGEDALALVDFGIAKQQAAGLTLTGARAATPAFAPLEQFSGHTGAHSDVYALGATLYYLLSGVEPPDARLTAAGMAQLTPLRAFNPQISAATERAVQQAMALRVSDRPPSVAALQAALQGTAGPPPPPSSATAPRPARPQGVRASWVALAGLALLAGLTGLLLALNRPDRTEKIAAATSVATTVIAATNTATTTATPTRTLPATDTPTATTSLPVVPAPTDVVTATLDATRLPTATLPISDMPAAGRAPTSTPAVTDTPAPTPQPTSTPRPTQPPAPPASTLPSLPAPSVVAPQLSGPPNGSEQRNQVLLQWTHSGGLKEGQKYRINLRTENPQDPQDYYLTSVDTSLQIRYDQHPAFFKDDGTTFFWSVVVINSSGNVVSGRSEERRFVMRRDLTPPALPTQPLQTPEPPTPEPPTPEPPTPEPPTPTPTPRS